MTIQVIKDQIQTEINLSQDENEVKALKTLQKQLVGFPEHFQPSSAAVNIRSLRNITESYSTPKETATYERYIAILENA